jgi:uncharacterized protein YegL
MCFELTKSPSMAHLNSFIKRNFTSAIILVIILSWSNYCTAQNPKNQKSVLLIIDVSGSMMGEKMDSVKSAAKQIITMLLPCNTEFAIMGFNGKVENPVPFRMNFSTNKIELFAFIDKLKPMGGTLIGAALKIGSFYIAEHAKLNKTSKHTIILLSDGKSDDNIAQALKDLKEKKALIQTECIGYMLTEEKIAEQQLAQIAMETGGEYYSATAVSNVIKAFFKSGIKTIIKDVPVMVRKNNKGFNFKLPPPNSYKMLTTQNWFLDSIQINVSEEIYDMVKLTTEENMQDTMPKSLVFDNSRKVSLFIDNGIGYMNYKKWVEGDFTFTNNALTIKILNYYFKLIVKDIDKNRLVLCVNKFEFLSFSTNEPKEELCNCSNSIASNSPYILVYFSKAGCDR